MLPELERRVTALERRIKNGLTLARLTVTGALTGATATFTSLSITAGAITSGTYTPTLTNTTNIDASTAFQCQYIRVGSVVTVSGRVEVDATAAAATVLGISLPIASDLGANTNCAGVIARAGANAGEIHARPANDRAEASWTASVTTNAAYYFTFTYLII